MPRCKHCGWRAIVVDGVISLVSNSDKADPILGSYFNNYDQIADDDLATPILNREYVKHQVANMVRYTGDVRGKKLLDVGCGQGWLAKALVAAGASEVVAVDISLAYLRRIAGSPQITPVHANAESLPFRKGFDVLTSTDVLEHVLNVGSFLISANQSLNMNGKIVIRVPLLENLVAYSAQRGCKYRFVHLRTFDKALLRHALEGAGFAVTSFNVDGFSIQTPQPFWMRGRRRMALYMKLQTWLVKRMADPSRVTTWNPVLASLFMRPQEIVVVGQKVASISDA